MKNASLAILFITFLSIFSQATTLSTDTQNLVDVLKLENAAPRTWPGYNFFDNKFVVYDLTKSPTEFFVLDKISSSFEPMVGSFALPNKLYEFCGSPFSICPDPSLSNAIVYNIDNALKPVSTIYGLPYEILNAIVILHEGFHLFVQYLGRANGIWSDQVTGLTGVERNQVDRQCYAADKATESLILSELQMLMAALKQANRQDFISAKASAIKALEFADRRYQGLASAFPNCKELEIKMELNEGIPEFVAHQSLINSKVMTYEQVEKYIQGSIDSFAGTGSHYYRTGAMKMLILSADPSWKIQDSIAKIINGKILAGGLSQEFSSWAH